MAAAVQQVVRVVISADRLRAHLIVADCDPAHVTRPNILARLSTLAIPVTEAVERRIDELLVQLQAGKAPQEPVLLAEGRAPVPGVAALFEPAPRQTSEPSEAGPTDIHCTRIITALPDQAIGVLTPEASPVDGSDVFGKRIRAAGPSASTRLGKNVRLADDGRTVLATAAGQVRSTRGEVTIMDVVEIDGDVDLGTGNVDAPVDVVIKGTVRDTYAVRSRGNVTVQRAVEVATIEAGGDIHVLGGVTAQGGGRVIAGGNISIKFCDAAKLRAGKDITIAAEALRSQIYAAGKISISHGKIVGGSAYAREGMEVQELGNEASLHTHIAVGVDPEALAEGQKAEPAIAEKKRAAAQIRERLAPLTARMRQLTPRQREQATELMFQADQMETEADEQQKRIAALIAARSPTGQPLLRVHGRIFPGVALDFGMQQTTFREEYRGPLKVFRQQVEGAEQTVLLNDVSNGMTVLPSFTVPLNPSPTVAAGG